MCSSMVNLHWLFRVNDKNSTFWNLVHNLYSHLLHFFDLSHTTCQNFIIKPAQTALIIKPSLTYFQLFDFGTQKLVVCIFRILQQCFDEKSSQFFLAWQLNLYSQQKCKQSSFSKVKLSKIDESDEFSSF